MNSAATIGFIRDGAQAATLLKSPVRPRLLHMLATPDSASGLARKLEQPRQRVHYHLRALEKAGLVAQVASQRRGNCVERLLQATARAWVLSPEVLAGLEADPKAIRDRFSSSYLVAVLAASLGDLAAQRAAAQQAGKRLATLTLQCDVRFASPRERKAFSEELSGCLAQLVSKYHDAQAEGGRSFRFTVAAHPTPAAHAEED